MIRRSALVLLGLAATAWADGDKPSPPPAPEPAKPAQGPDAAKKDAAPAEAPPVHGARYKVTLRTGRTFVGIVPGEHVYERRDAAMSWVAADKDAAGAGVRLYFTKGLEGFLFLPMRDVKTVEKLGDVTDDEGRDLAHQRTAAVLRANEERERLRRDRAAREAVEKAAAEAAEKSKAEAAKPAADADKAKAPSAEEQLARYTALLTKYPPGKWTPDSPKEIERRRVVMDLLPSDEDKAFLAVFDDWKKAYDVWKLGQDKAAPSSSAPAPSTPPAAPPKK